MFYGCVDMFRSSVCSEMQVALSLYLNNKADFDETCHFILHFEYASCKKCREKQMHCAWFVSFNHLFLNITQEVTSSSRIHYGTPAIVGRDDFLFGVQKEHIRRNSLHRLPEIMYVYSD